MLDLGISVRARVLVFPLAASSHEAASFDGRDGTTESHDRAQPLRRPGRSCKAEGSDAFLALRLQQRELEHQKRAVKKGVKKPIANNPKTRVVTNHTSTSSQSTQVSSVFPRPRYPAALTVFPPWLAHRISQLLCDQSPSRSVRQPLRRRAPRKVRRGLSRKIRARGARRALRVAADHPARKWRTSSPAFHGIVPSPRPIDHSDPRARRLTMRRMRCGCKRRNTRMVSCAFPESHFCLVDRCLRVSPRPLFFDRI